MERLDRAVVTAYGLALALEFVLLSKWVGGVRTAAGLLDRACAVEMLKIMDAVGEAHVRTARRLLQEAVERGPTGAGREKCRMAITNLEVAYDAFTRLPTGWRGPVSKAFFPKRYRRAHLDAATVSVLSAGGYAAIGLDEKSVEHCLDRCVGHLWERHVFIWLDACSGRSLPFDAEVSQRLADEHGHYVGAAMKIADLAGLAGKPQQPDDWPHWRDPRVRERSILRR